MLDDEVGHFLVARDSWVHPQLLLNAWGRVGTTIAFVLPAAAGLDVARGAALAMSAATFVLLVIVETVLFRFGLFGSGGNVDYLVSGRFGLSWKRLRAAGSESSRASAAAGWPSCGDAAVRAPTAACVA